MYTSKKVHLLGTLLLLITAGRAKSIENHPTSLVIERITSVPLHYPIRFVFLADTRNSFEQGDRTGDSIFSVERGKIEEISPLFVLHGGDFVRSGFQSEYEEFVDSIDAFQVNLLTVRGNHELYADEGPYMYQSIFGPSDYFFDYGNYRFIVLADCQQNPYTNWEGMHYIDYLVSESQLDWLDSILTQGEFLGMFQFVFAHIPPYIPGHDTTHCLGWSNYYPQPNYELSHTEQFTDLLREHRVLLGSFGHQHFYDRWTQDGVAYLISGGGGSPLVYPPLSDPPNGGSFYHFVLLELYEYGVVTGYVYEAGQDEPNQMYTFSLEYPKVKENPGMGKTDCLSIRVHPNVVLEGREFVIRYTLLGEGFSSLKLLDAAGRSLRAFRLRGREGIIPVQGIEREGLYLLLISSGRMSKSKKFLVIK